MSWYVVYDRGTGALVAEGADVGPTPPPGCALTQIASAPGAGEGWDATTRAYVTDAAKALVSLRRRELGVGAWATDAQPKIASWLAAQQARNLAAGRLAAGQVGQAEVDAAQSALATAEAAMTAAVNSWKTATA